MTPEEQACLREHRLCVVTALRGDGSPQSTPFYCVYEDDKLFISVTKTRKKTINVERDARVSGAVLAEEFPFRHLQVQGTVVVTDDDLVETTRRIWSKFRDKLPDDLTDVLREQQRTLMVVRPTHVTSNLQVPR